MKGENGGEGKDREKIGKLVFEKFGVGCCEVDLEEKWFVLPYDKNGSCCWEI